MQTGSAPARRMQHSRTVHEGHTSCGSPSNNCQLLLTCACYLSLSRTQVSTCYPKETEGLAKQLMELLDTHFAVLDPPLRKHLVQALILMRNRNQVSSTGGLCSTHGDAVASVVLWVGCEALACLPAFTCCLARQ